MAQRALRVRRARRCGGGGGCGGTTHGARDVIDAERAGRARARRRGVRIVLIVVEQQRRDLRVRTVRTQMHTRRRVVSALQLKRSKVPTASLCVATRSMILIARRRGHAHRADEQRRLPAVRVVARFVRLDADEALRRARRSEETRKDGAGEIGRKRLVDRGAGRFDRSAGEHSSPERPVSARARICEVRSSASEVSKLKIRPNTHIRVDFGIAWNLEVRDSDSIIFYFIFHGWSGTAIGAVSKPAGSVPSLGECRFTSQLKSTRLESNRRVAQHHSPLRCAASV